jgi:predicted double-glycine peptidase
MDKLTKSQTNREAADCIRPVMHYRQTTDFTCGPAALLMAMRAQNSAARFDRTEELQIWREANTVYMGSRSTHAGCSALGLALAAQRRGFCVEVRVSHNQPLLQGSARHPDLLDANRLLHQVDLAQAIAECIKISNDVPGPQHLPALLQAGILPVVLASTSYLDRSRAPHWIVVTGAEDGIVYMSDPWVNAEQGELASDRTSIPLPFQRFRTIARYGSRRERAMVLVGRPRGTDGPHIGGRS